MLNKTQTIDEGNGEKIQKIDSFGFSSEIESIEKVN